MKFIYTFVTVTKDIILSFAWLVDEPKESDLDELRIPEGVQLDDGLSFNLPTNG